jgi:hypothetical protein
MDNPKTIRECLKIMTDRSYSSDDIKWEVLAIILREICLSEGYDLDHDFSKENS